MTIRILVGDVRERLKELHDGSVQCVVTSPPYFGLRDYGTAQWDGGDPACDHNPARRAPGEAKASTLGGGKTVIYAQEMGVSAYRDSCRKCGAVRVDQQIGLEGTLQEYIDTLVQVFREVRRVLHLTGTVWLNMGDSYASAWPAPNTRRNIVGNPMTGGKRGPHRQSKLHGSLKEKDLMMVPARVAIALQDDGWWLRSDIIWAKKNGMPESVTDRPTNSHEHIFLLTKQSRYFYDSDAVRTAAAEVSVLRLERADLREKPGWSEAFHGNAPERLRRDKQRGHSRRHAGFNDRWDARTRDEQMAVGANLRNVWTIATQGFPDAHFATFPSEIPRRCIKAGTSEKGQCAACGAPWVRVVEREPVPEEAFSRGQPSSTVRGVSDSSWLHIPGSRQHLIPQQHTTGWQPSCRCNAGEPVPQVVLDPFLGSGTTLLVADQLGRDGVGIELNESYALMAENRIRGDAPLFARVVAD